MKIIIIYERNWLSICAVLCSMPINCDFKMKYIAKKKYSDRIFLERLCTSGDRMVVGFTTTYAISAYYH